MEQSEKQPEEISEENSRVSSVDQKSLIKYFDPRTKEGLPFIATLIGFFALLTFGFVLLNTGFTIINWNPFVWLMGKLPFYMIRVIMSFVMLYFSFGGLIITLGLVKLLHLLHSWKNKS